ncbi:isochorismatase [Xylariaceae sp. FL0255]|nr:isochorismatase [Xylariaceae sp. FL0255]
MSTDFRPALIVVDVQEDFNPPNGSLAVPGGRDIAEPINKLLALPSFVLKVATKDWHPANHISFASNHASASPFTSTAEVIHPSDASQSYTTRLWPIHCVQDTAGAALIPELDTTHLDAVIEKGTDRRVEMYSAFYDPFKVSDSGLAELLRKHRVTDVYVVGLAADYCVAATAEDAAREGFKTFLVEECTRPVDSASGAWVGALRDRLAATATAENTRRNKSGGEGPPSVRVVSLGGPEVGRLLGLKLEMEA